MTKYRYRWPITIGVSIAMWAGIIYAAKADGIKDAAILAIDRQVCGLTIDQSRINRALVNAAREHGIDADTAFNAAISATIELRNVVDNAPYKDVVSYCAARSGPNPKAL